MSQVSNDAKVVIINGPAGVGKTTTARALARRGRNSACVHGDILRDFIVARWDGEVETGLGYRNGAAVVSNFIHGGYDLVVFEYVFETPQMFEHFYTNYDAGAPVYPLTLWASLETIQKREEARENREPLGKRVVECWETMKPHLGEMGEIINTEHMGLEETVNEIMRRIVGKPAPSTRK